MSERLPPLNALRVFDATMRHRSFRAAADALFVTPQAVSQQIKILEEHLNIQLFQRFGRSIEPTPDAVVLARFVENGLREFSSGVRMVTRSRYTDRINLNATPYFATRYLIPKMEGFRDIRPRCDIRLTTNVDMPEFDRDEIDVGIQWGYGDWPEFDTKLLMRDHKIICCAPSLMEGDKALRTPADLLHHTLLRPILPNHCWKDVIDHLGAGDVDPDNGIAFHDNASMRFAAMQGLGVGLVSARDAREEIRLGTLVAPFGEDVFWELPEERVPGFFLVYPQSRSVLPVVKDFCRWVSQQDWTN